MNNEIEEYISIITKTKKMRKLITSDILVPVKNNFNIRKCNRIRKYRMQQEYGEKKFLKP